VRENSIFARPKLSGGYLRLGKPPKIAQNLKKPLFAFFNFGIANLKRKNETTKFKNENFKIYSYVCQNLTTFAQFQK
jgi:hypothetical protein